MDFQRINSLNVRLNILSGNLLTMTADGSSFPMFWKIYSVLAWLIEIILMIVLIIGCAFVPKEKILKDGLICFAIAGEMFFMTIRLHACRNLISQLIQSLNDILRTADEIMKNIVRTTMKTVMIPFQFYWIAGVLSIIAWNSLSFALVFEKNLFLHEDYRVPAIFSSQPFSTKVFLSGSTFVMISTIYMFLKKVGADVYMVHLVLMVTAQYRYTALKIATIFEEQNDRSNIILKIRVPKINLQREKEMKALCQHHNAMMHITSLLKELLSLNFSFIYITSIFRFCFIGIMLSNIPSTTPWESISFIIYASGAIVQLYILCSCVQQLLDASTEVTDEAFHKEWYLFSKSMKHTFLLIIMANNLECKLATFENFNLSLPSFMMILNQSYSIAILFLRMK